MFLDIVNENKNKYKTTCKKRLFIQYKQVFTTTTFYTSKGSYDAISSFAFSWSVISRLRIDKIPEVAKTKVLKQKRYLLSKLRFCHASLKRLIQTRPTCLRHYVEIFA